MCAQKVTEPAGQWDVHVLGRSVAPCRARCAPTTRSIGRTVHGHLVMQVLVRSCTDVPCRARARARGAEERATTTPGIPREKLKRAAGAPQQQAGRGHCAPPVTYSRLERRCCRWPVVLRVETAGTGGNSAGTFSRCADSGRRPTPAAPTGEPARARGPGLLRPYRRQRIHTHMASPGPRCPEPPTRCHPLPARLRRTPPFCSSAFPPPLLIR